VKIEISVPKIRMPFFSRARPNKPDPIEKEFLEFSEKLLVEMREEGVKLLQQSLEQMRERHEQLRSNAENTV